MNRLLIEGESLFIGQRKNDVKVKVGGKLRDEYNLDLDDLDENDTVLDLK